MKQEYSHKNSELIKVENQLKNSEKTANSRKIMQEQYHKKLLDEQNARLNSRIMDLEGNLEKARKFEAEKEELEVKLDEMTQKRDKICLEKIDLENQLERADSVTSNLNNEATRYKKISAMQDKRLQKILVDSENVRKSFRTQKLGNLKESYRVVLLKC